MKRRRFLTPALVLLTGSLTAAACGDDSSTSGSTTSTSSSGGTGGTGGAGVGGAGGAGGGDGGGGEAGGLAWESCSLMTGQNDGEAECLTIPRPAIRSDPSVGDVNVFVKRAPALSGSPRGGLWFLAGGPGGTAMSFETSVPFFQQGLPDLDIYLFEHRGVGQSDRLGCPDQESPQSENGVEITTAELPDCLAYVQQTWGDRLPGFNGTEAAADLGEIIELVSAPDDETYVFGVSYGSQWAHRYSQLFPDQADGIILDSVCVPDCSFRGIDEWFHDLAQVFFAQCGADAFCSSKLTSDPAAQIASMYANLGTCSGLDPLYTPEFLQRFFANLMYDYTQRNLALVMIYRLERCSTADVNALNVLAGLLTQPAIPDPVNALGSSVLQLNVGLIDNYPDAPPDLAMLQAEVAGYDMALHTSVTFRQAFDIWPKHAKDAFHGELSDRMGPMLFEHGALDFIPPSAVTPLGDHFNASGQTVVIYPGGPHGVLGTTPTALADCSLDVFDQFLSDPSSPLDTSCVSDVLPVSFDVSGQLSQIAFGTTDAWEGDPASNVADVALPDGPAITRQLRQIGWRTRSRMVW